MVAMLEAGSAGMKRPLLAALIAATVAAPTAHAATLADLVEQVDGGKSCWQRVYEKTHLKNHPDQLVKSMTFGVEFHPHEDPEPDDPGFSLFGMSVAMRDGRTGTTGGGCWIGEGGQLRCGVECDGGGVELRMQPEGGLLIDLEATGYIRMEGECGGGTEDATFPLEPGLDDKRFLLHPVDVAICEPLLPDW